MPDLCDQSKPITCEDLILFLEENQAKFKKVSGQENIQEFFEIFFKEIIHHFGQEKSTEVITNCIYIGVEFLPKLFRLPVRNRD